MLSRAYLICFAVAFGVPVVSCVASSQQQSNTTLTFRSPFQSGSPERESLMRLPYNCRLSFIQVVPLGGGSNTPESIAEFFTPSGKSTLLAAEDFATGSEGRDLAVSSFNIKTKRDTFKSEILFGGVNRFVGVGIAWRQFLNKHWWLEAATPYLRVANRFTIQEDVIDDGGGPVDQIGLDGAPFVGTMTEAFRQPNWRFGRIDSRLKQVKDGFGDLELKLGYQPEDTDYLRLYGYIGFLFPTGNKPDGRFVFEPIVGSNGHYGFLYGSHMGVNMWRREEHELGVTFDIHTRYLFRNHQIRSFDIKDKEFSRYIATYRDAEEAEAAAEQQNINSGTSGINIFTQPLKVFPGFSVSFMSALLYIYREFLLEFGYNFYARQAEDVELVWRRTSAVKDVGGLGGTNRARTISENFSAAVIPVKEYTPLQGRDIGLTSAAAPALLSYIPYLALGYQVCTGDYPVLVGAGVSYEFTANLGANRWMAWGKFGLSF